MDCCSHRWRTAYSEFLQSFVLKFVDLVGNGYIVHLASLCTSLSSLNLTLEQPQEIYFKNMI
jgi:hypothetical protein